MMPIDVPNVIAEKLLGSLEQAFPQPVRRAISLPRVPVGKAHAVIGMRRAGKTTFLLQCLADRLARGIERSRLVYFNFEDERLGGMRADQLHLVTDSYFRLHPLNREAQVTFAFDEIQVVPGWETFVRRVLDEGHVEILLSGSSARMLSREVATSMRGRAMETIVTPFSFGEFCLATIGHTPASKVSAKDRSQLENAFGRYMEIGGFPEATEMPRRERIQLLQGYVDAVMLRDIVERHRVSNVAALRALTRQLISNPGCQASITKLSKDLTSQGYPIGKDTVRALMDYLADAFLIRRLQILTESERVRQTNPSKIYLADHSISVAYKAKDRDRGHHLENIVACELNRRSQSVHYMRTSSGYEVDFAARDWDGNLTLIQVANTISDPKTAKRECRALADALQEYPDARPLIITELEEHSIDFDGLTIPVVPAWRWTNQF